MKFKLTTYLSHRNPARIVAAILLLATFAANPASAIPPIPSKPAPATDQAVAQVPPMLASPQTTLTTFLESMAKGSADGYATAATCFETKSLPTSISVRDRVMGDFAKAIQWLGWNLTTAKELPAGSFKGERTPMFPATSNFSAPIQQQSTRLLADFRGEWKVELVRSDDSSYRFPKSVTAAGTLDGVTDAITRMRRASGDKPKTVRDLAEWMRLNAPEWALNRVVFLAIWQWIGLATIVLVGLIVDFFVRLFTARILRSIIKRFYKPTDPPLVRRAARGVGVVASTLIWLTLLTLLELPLAGLSIIEPAAKFAFVLAVLIAGWRLIDLFAELIGQHASKSATRIDDVLIPMVRKTAKVILVIFGLLNLAPILGLDLGPLLAAIGIGSFGLAFAFKNSLENVFGSVTVILDRPFMVGDWVVIDGVEGTVEDVGLRSTKVRTFYNSLVSIPNSNLITKSVDNYGRRKYRRWSTKVGILYGTPPARIDAFCEGIRELVRQHPYTRKDYYQVWLNGFAESSLEVLVYVFWEAPDWQTELRERHRLMLDIIRIADELGIDFAFPTRTLHVRRADSNNDPKDDQLDAADPISARRSGRVTTREVVAGDPWLAEKPPPYNFLSAEETKRLDAMSDEDRAAAIETRLAQRNSAETAAKAAEEAGDGSEKVDFTEQRDSGG
jgi:MscS family membrane protein